MIENLLNRLLSISDKICFIIDHLTELSHLDLENTPEYTTLINSLKGLVYQESIIINTIKTKDLKELIVILAKRNEDSISINRLYSLIDEKLDEIYNVKETDKDTDNEKELENNVDEDNVDDDEYDEEYMKINSKEDNPFLEEYYESEDDIEKYSDYIIDRVLIIVLKQMSSRIDSTIASSRIEKRQKRILLNTLREFKYFVFTLDNKLEKIAIEYGFNIEKVPYIKSINIDYLPIYFNECLQIIYRLYSNSIDKKTKPNDVLENLFDLMCFEEYIKELNIERIDTLIEVCEELSKQNQKYNCGQFCYKKLLQKKN